MHEYSLVRSLLRQVENIVRREGAERATAVRIRVGEFSGIESTLLRSAFEELAPDSSAWEADLHVESVRLEARCHDCGTAFAVERFRFVCPSCEGTKLEILGGEELVLESVTLERCD